MTKWRVWYEDGTYADGGVLRPLGVVCVVFAHDQTGRMILSGYDYYIQLDHGWIGAGYDTLLYYITHCLHRVRRVVVGVMLGVDEFAAIYAMAKNDPAFPEKSASHTRERPLVSVGHVD